MKILAIDASSVSVSAALCEDDAVLGEEFIHIRQTHSETLMPGVASLLARCGVAPTDIGLFAVTAGPGSFTGVRIGVAAVKGLAVARNIPCVPVSSLEAAAAGIPCFDGVVCAVMDARRGQFYNALFDGKNLNRLTPDRAVSAELLGAELKKLQKPAFLVGDGAKLCYNNLHAECSVMTAPDRMCYPRGAAVAALGLREYRAGKALLPAELMPVYLRLPQAERELKRRQAAQEPGKEA